MWLLLAVIASKKTWKAFEFKVIHEPMEAFLTKFNPDHLLSANTKLFQLVSCYSEYLLSGDKAIYGIRPIREAIMLSRDSLEQITPMHREFAKLCLKAKCYMHALPIIETPITSFKKSTSPLDIIAYNYYRGLLFIGLQKYNQAIESFKLAISLPTGVVHKVHLESYKKLVLINLIHNGRMPSLPANTSPLLKMRIDNTLLTYKNLGQYYLYKDEQNFTQIVTKHFTEFQ